MKILITGSTGFIGSHLVHFFIGQKYDVVGTYRRKIKNQVIGCRYICIDLAKEDLEQEKFDCIIHCAGQVEDGITWDYIENSILATNRLIFYCEQIQCEMIIFMSSISVYGECSDYVDEDSDKKNLNDYALCKVLCENMIRSSNIKNKYIIRLSRILGDGGFESGGFLSKFSELLIKGEKVCYSNGNILYNNMFYISDLEKICKMLIELKNEESYICVGVGAANPISLKEIIIKMKKYLNSQSELLEVSSNQTLTCHLINTKRLDEMGFEAMSVDETIYKFSKDALKRFK